MNLSPNPSQPIADKLLAELTRLDIAVTKMRVALDRIATLMAPPPKRSRKKTSSA